MKPDGRARGEWEEGVGVAARRGRGAPVGLRIARPPRRLETVRLARLVSEVGADDEAVQVVLVPPREHRPHADRLRLRILVHVPM